jgi:hypothetical protein
MPNRALISTVTNGVVPTLAALRAIDNTTLGENATVTVLGSGAANDGFGGSYFFAAASTATDDGGNNAIAPNAGTGRWLKAPTYGAYTGVGPVATSSPVAAAASSYIGSRESFVLISGASQNTSYTLPSTATMNGQVIRFKQVGTGAYTIRTAGTDLLFDGTGLAVQIPHNPLKTGQSVTLQCHGSVYYTI